MIRTMQLFAISMFFLGFFAAPSCSDGGGRRGGGSGDGGADGDGDSDADADQSCSDTLNDPNNCGVCGHVCSSRVCANGQCKPGLSPCVARTDYANCNTVCAASGQSCVPNACDGYTYVSSTTMSDCTLLGPSWTGSTGSCSEVLGWGEAIRCCCTDNPVAGDADVAATCADTLSDPLNCGICGYRCRSDVCTNGKCGPALSPCLSYTTFTDCNAVCASIGETCVPAACT